MSLAISKEKYFDLIGYVPHEKQRLFHDSTARFKIPVCGRRFGKLLEVNTPIPTPDGMVPMGVLEHGDIVFDEHGHPCTVIGTSNIQARTDAFLVTFDDGSTLVAHGEHEWLTYDKAARKALTDSRRMTKPAVRTTNKIASTLYTKSKKPEVNHAITLAGPVQYAKKDLPIDPYVLGVWLGDGSSSDGIVTIPDSDSWIIDKISARGWEVTRHEHKDRCTSWRIHGLRVLLREQLLLGTKHVPTTYLYGSVEQRMDLLHGLMDSDGSVANNHVDFDSTNKNLVDAVDSLICSLGGRVVRSQRVGKLYGVPKKLCYRIHTGNIIDVFSLPRKLAAQRALPRRKHYFRFITSITPITRPVWMKCIAVDSKSHLYLAGGSYIATHNTFMGAREVEPILMIPNKHVWIVGPCVDEETEILTARGWLRYDEVVVGDKTLSINPITGLSEWDTVEKVLLNPGTHDVIRMEGHSFSALTTPDHRWLTQRRPGIGYKKDGSKLPSVLKPIEHLLPETDNGWTWRTTATLTADDRIPKAAVCATVPTEPKYTDAFVELVAWLWAEGSRNGSRGDGLTIHQSHVANPDNVARIRRALTELCPNPHLGDSYHAFEYWSDRIYATSPNMTRFNIGKVLGREFKKVFLDHKIVDPQFIMDLTFSQLKLFVDISMLGDGTVGKQYKDGYESCQKVIYQESKEQLFAVQLACSLIGIATSIRPRTKDGNNGWVLGLLTSRFINPQRAQYVAGPRGIKIGGEQYIGTVWCVTTKNGNWLAKRNSSVYYTGNTYD